VEDLRTAIVQSSRYRTLQLELEAVRKALTEDGDGLPISDLIAECTEVDLDEVAAREQRIGEEMALSRERLMEAREVLADARRSFEAVGAAIEPRTLLQIGKPLFRKYAMSPSNMWIFVRAYCCCNGQSSVTVLKSRLRS
jgi:hypothetical protein